MKIKLTPPEGIRVTKKVITANQKRLKVLVLSAEEKTEKAPGVLWLHGGGYLTGMKEMVYMSRAIDLVRKFNAVVVAPDYTLSLKKPYPAALDDCHEVLCWLKENAEELGIRDDQIMVGGESAGGGLCAALCMLARDRQSVNIAYQIPLYPMLDHNDTASSKDNHGRIWNTRRNHLAWKAYLRDLDENDIPVYASPAGQDDYRNLPPCYSFVGDGEPFYCETLQYIDNLEKAGIEAQVDVYHTDIHAFDMLYPDKEISKKAAEAFNEHFENAVKHYYKPQNADHALKEAHMEKKEELKVTEKKVKPSLVIATNNNGKVAEYRDIFEPLGFEVFSQREKGINIDVEETGTTFEENALLKAKAVYDIAHCAVISDDSGLEVEALNLEPGIYSARYKGLETEHERRMAILEGLKDKENRHARFVCYICYIDAEGKEHLFKGIWQGNIAFKEEGTNGFGYDPIFISEDSKGHTTASLPISFKETYSHRAKAVKMLMEYLNEK